MRKLINFISFGSCLLVLSVNTLKGQVQEEFTDEEIQEHFFNLIDPILSEAACVAFTSVENSMDRIKIYAEHSKMAFLLGLPIMATDYAKENKLSIQQEYQLGYAYPTYVGKSELKWLMECQVFKEYVIWYKHETINASKELVGGREIKRAKRVVELSLKEKDHEKKALYLIMAGNLFAVKNRVEKARNSYEQAIQLFKKDDARTYLARIYKGELLDL